jgi:hypothetical protein
VRRRRHRARPRRLQIADVLPAAGSEIVFCTEGGRILVMNSALAIQVDIAEPGVQDFVIGPVPSLRAPSPVLSKPIYVLSTSGHVLAIDYGMPPGGPPQSFLIAASELQYGGGAWDLEVVPYGGSDHIVAMYCPQPGNAKSLRILDRNTLTVLTQFANVPAPEPPDIGEPIVNVPLPSNNTQPEVAILAGTSPRFVTLINDYVAVWDLGSDLPAGFKYAGKFAPARGATCVQVGDVMPDAGYGGEESCWRRRPDTSCG